MLLKNIDSFRVRSRYSILLSSLPILFSLSTFWRVAIFSSTWCVFHWGFEFDNFSLGWILISYIQHSDVYFIHVAAMEYLSLSNPSSHIESAKLKLVTDRCVIFKETSKFRILRKNSNRRRIEYFPQKSAFDILGGNWIISIRMTHRLVERHITTKKQSRIYTYIYIYIYIERERDRQTDRGVHDVVVSVEGNRHSNTCSNPGREHKNFTMFKYPCGRY